MLTKQGGWAEHKSAQSHLANMGIAKGDLFLFFGWFRQAILRNDNWFYKPGSPDLHVIFGWLQVDEVLSVGSSFDQIVDKKAMVEKSPASSCPRADAKEQCDLCCI